MSIQNIANLSKNDILSTNLINPDLKGRRPKTETQERKFSTALIIDRQLSRQKIRQKFSVREHFIYDVR